MIFLDLSPLITGYNVLFCWHFLGYFIYQ